MVVTDLDGTLLDAHARLGAANRRALERLGESGSLRVVATGRSLHSAESVLDADFPIDYLVFSSGAGILDWRSRELLAAHGMRAEDAEEVLGALLSRGLDFMVHHGIPDNHYFYYHQPSAGVAGGNPDFDRRCARYREFARPLTGDGLSAIEVSQFLAIETPSSDSCYETLVTELTRLNVVLTTSPLDHRSRWIEIFPPAASKSRASEWLRHRHAVAHAEVLAVGNDYNDRDLLEWAENAYVVANAAPPLRARYRVVASNDAQGFAEAVAAQGLV
jgi:hydroxymethylpyrimidine pyrophosphatase-like HAD family hydrolase